MEMVKQPPFYVMIWNHPIETTIKKTGCLEFQDHMNNIQITYVTIVYIFLSERDAFSITVRGATL